MSRHLATSSKGVYTSEGVKHFNAFCTEYDINILDYLNPHDLKQLIIYFAYYDRSRKSQKTKAPIMSCTISGHISHVAEELLSRELITDGKELRCRRLNWMLKVWQEDDYATVPRRLRNKITLSYDLFCMAIDLIPSVFPTSIPTQKALRASLSLGTMLSLRPNEYLCVTRDQPVDSTVNTDHSYCCWGNDTIVKITDKHLFPPGLPSDFLTFVDKRKNDKVGANGPLSFANTPHRTHNPMEYVFDYILSYPQSPSTPILAAHGAHLKDDDLNKLLKALAHQLGIDPSRLVPHSARFMAITQLEDASNEEKQRLGYWKTMAGAQWYARHMLQFGRNIADRLTDKTRFPRSFAILQAQG